MKQIIIIALLFLGIESIKAQERRRLKDSISIFFDDIKTASKKNIRLWNKDLYGPMMIVNPKTREIFANESDTANTLKLNGGIYSGALPARINIANTAINWNGKRWAMIMLPLPEQKQNRINLLAHESFHRIQPSLGFTLNNTENNHLDQKNGRIYLRLELEALKKAIQARSRGDQQQYLTDALTFRKYRHALYSNSAETENSLELNEGIAEFTGVIVSGRNKAQTKAFFLNGIDDFFKNPTFVRSFAYHTVPVYGYLLYRKNSDWNKKVTAKTDLTDVFINEFAINIPANLETKIDEISNRYNGAAIIDEETVREEKTKALIAEYKALFIDRPHFEIKFEKMNVSFDPRNIVPIDNKGTVYPTIRVTDLWGVLTVEKGALMSPNWDRISISNPVAIDGKKISGDGWKLDLADGYSVSKDEATGNYRIVKNK
ncbi:hypothetical protein [Chryseobacterium sp. JK1]|uniref:hypothetical protein n=1 Tax=Chryseobacterium sp. JK1 TaxID=874294 RepID=UPI003D681446